LFGSFEPAPGFFEVGRRRPSSQTLAAGSYHEGVRAIGVHRDDDGRIVRRAARSRVEVLAELHDVHAVLTQAADRVRVRLAGGQLPLDVRGDFFLGDMAFTYGPSLKEDVTLPPRQTRHQPPRVSAEQGDWRWSRQLSWGLWSRMTIDLFFQDC